MRRGAIVLLCLSALAGGAGIAYAAFVSTTSNSGSTFAAASSYPRCYGDAVLTDSPSKYWRLDETSGTTATDSMASGNGTYTGGVTVGQSGALAESPNKAASFDGVDDWVDIPDQSFSGDFTIEFWVNLTGTINQADGVVGQEGTGQDINFANGKARLYTGSTDVVIANDPIVSGTWEHYAIARSGSALTLYRNGVQDGTGTWASTTFTPKALGRGNAGFLGGRIDDVSMYGSALTETRVRAHYNAGRCYRDEPLADSPTGYWRLGETSAAVTAFDSSSTNNGLFVNGVTLNQTTGIDGDTGKAASFDGSTGNISIPYSVGVNPDAPFSIEAWVKLPSIPAGNVVYWSNKRVTGVPAGLSLYVGSNGRLQSEVGDGTGWGYVDSGASGTITAGQWTHAVFVYNGTAASWYINGVQTRAFTTEGYNPQRNSSTGALIGAYTTGGLFWNGTIDDTSIYNTALSASRIRAHYYTGRAYRDVVLADGPQSYWRLGETSGTTAADSAGSDTGTYTNGVLLDQAPAVMGDSNRAVTFDGTNDYMSTGSVLSGSTGAFSFECWVKSPNYNVTFANNQNLMTDANGQSGRYLYYHSNSFVFGIFNTGDWYKSAGATTPSVNAWHHVVGTYDGDKTLTLYVDGQQAGQYVNATTMVPVAANTPFLLGKNPPGANYLTGSLDEAAVYTKALTPDQVQLHYEAGRDAPR